MEDRLEKIEILLSEHAATLDDLHHMVRLQDQEITRLRAQVRLLLERAADADADGAEIIADQKPPHW